MTDGSRFGGGPAGGSPVGASPADGGPAAARSRDGFDGVVLAGGTSRRFGGGDKTAAVVGGRSLLGHAVQALVDAGARTVVVVGPRLPPDVPAGPTSTLVLTREDPAGSGPVPGLAAGLRHVTAEVAVVLAADLPGVDARAVLGLVDALARSVPDDDAVVVQDVDGRAQWLTAAYRAHPMRDAVDEALAAAAARGDADRSPGLRDVASRIRWTGAPLPSGWGRLVDVDTPEDLSRARLDDWTARLVQELQLHPATRQMPVGELVDLVLDLARDAAHTVARPAAPLTTFALGVAAGLAAGRDDAAPDLIGLRDRILTMLPPESPEPPESAESPEAPAEPAADGEG